MVRSGGFAGIMRRGEADTAGDPVLRSLVARVDLTSAPSSRGPVPDQFVYEIGIDGREITVGDSQLNGALRELVHHVLRHD
ncbi:hypothetical protein GCM10010468_72220 [Actinocorallia longicatena]|uniref:Uncharacterized protein n=1 Tax=Actinocorallia longicatena TaxID=111803 RepID=A0ABP6QKA5_9ACTN